MSVRLHVVNSASWGRWPGGCAPHRVLQRASGEAVADPVACDDCHVRRPATAGIWPQYGLIVTARRRLASGCGARLFCAASADIFSLASSALMCTGPMMCVVLAATPACTMLPSCMMRGSSTFACALSQNTCGHESNEHAQQLR